MEIKWVVPMDKQWTTLATKGCTETFWDDGHLLHICQMNLKVFIYFKCVYSSVYMLIYSLTMFTVKYIFYLWQIDEETVAELFLGAPKSLQMVAAAMKLKDTYYSLEGKLWTT